MSQNDLLIKILTREATKDEKETYCHKEVERAKEEAKKNLTGEDLEKCFRALEAWERNMIGE